jgi:hypothetical protein
MTTPARHLWEIVHPYYCAEGNYFKVGQHTLWNSWQSFRDDTVFVTGDRNQNLLFRWDWQRDGNRHSLLLFFVIQRKGFNCSHEIAVTAEDEPEIRKWLYECAVALRETWEPFIDALDGPATA